MADQFVASGTSAATIQGYINSAVRGDTITFEAGATFDGAFTLPVKTGTNDGTDVNSVILRSSALSGLPSGTRVNPNTSGSMARIRTATSSPIFTADSGAGGYKFLGLELSTIQASPADFFIVNILIDLTLAGSYFTIDRCFLHPQEYPNTTAPYHTTGRFAVALNGSHYRITNSYFGGFFGLYYGTTTGATPVDTVCIAVGDVDDLVTDNNYLECWYNPIFLGGSDTAATSSATITTATLTSATLSNTTGLSIGDVVALELPVDNISSTLNGALNNSDTTINVISTTGWDSAGYAVIDVGTGSQEHIKYTGKTATSLTGVTRGVDGNSPVSHSNSAPIKEGYCKRGAGFTCWGNGIVQTKSGNDITFTTLVGTNYAGGFAINIPASVVPAGQAVWMGKKIQNVTISRNRIHLPTAFSQWVMTNNGNHPKGYMEIKSLENSTIEGNYLDGYFATIGFNTTNQNGGSPWLRLYNVTVRNNWMKGTRSLCFLVFDEQYYMCTNGGLVTITNNLATEPDVNAEAGELPSLISIGNGGDNITVTHNTYYGGDSYTQRWAQWDLLLSPRNVAAGVVIKDNILYSGNYGFGCGTSPFTTGTCWTLTEDQNLFVLNVNPPNSNPVTDQGFINSLTAANTAAVRFANVGGSHPSDYSLLSDSPGFHTATDGADIGANMTQIFNALSPTDQAEIGVSTPFGAAVKLIAICM